MPGSASARVSAATGLSRIPSPRKRLTQTATSHAAATSSSPSKSATAVPPASIAAYLCVKESTGHELQSAEELEWALQHAGYNPTRAFMDRHWERGSRETMSYREFHHILQTEPTPRKLDVVSYFRTFDPRGEGTLDSERFVRAMTAAKEGDNGVSEDVVRSLVGNPKYRRPGGMFDYIAFCGDVFKTSADLIDLAKQRAATAEESLELNSKTYKVKRKASGAQADAAAAAAKISALVSSVTTNGAFYFEGDSIISHQYNMEVAVDGAHEISIRPSGDANAASADCQLYIFRVESSVGGGGADDEADSLAASMSSRATTDSSSVASGGIRYHYVGRSPLVLSGGFVSNESLQEYSSWTGHLQAGKYLLVPMTTGCKLQKRKGQPASDLKLVSSTSGGPDGGVSLTPDFESVLRRIYTQVDLDGNGTLSRTEFNLFNWRTSGEEVQDEEWQVVKDNFAMRNGELTLEGFLQLHQMEAEDNGGDSAELWITLNAMGFNVQLQQDESALFQITVKGESKELPPRMEVRGLRSGGSLTDRARVRCVLEGAKQHRSRVRSVAGSSDQVLLYREDTPTCTSLVLQNRSPAPIMLEVDFGESRNALINHPHQRFSMSLSAKTTMFLAHFVPADPLREHQVVVKERLLAVKAR